MTTSDMNIMHGWFSEKQQNHLIERNEQCYQREYGKYRPYIYYIDTNNKVVMISEITDSENKKPNFDDVVYIGIMKHFYKTSTEPINIHDENIQYYKQNPEITHDEQVYQV